jgi:putative oxidoreductase
LSNLPLINLGLALLRLFVGLTLAAHGSQKVFGWFGGYGMKGFHGMVAQMGFKPAGLWAWAAALAESGGGILLALGLLSPMGNFAVIGAMIVAISSVHASKGFFNTNGGYEFPLLLLVSSLALAITGPGVFSLDAILSTEFAAPIGIVVMLLSLAGALTALASRHITAIQERRAQTT